MFFSIIILLLIRLCHSTNITTTSSAACVLYNEDGSIRPYRVVVSVDKRLLEIFLNWLIFYAECCHNFKHLDIICLDTTVQKEIELLGLKCHAKSFFIKGNSDEVTTKGTLWTYKKTKNASNVQSVDKLGALWTFRVSIIIEYVSSNIDVILSDADALWLKDPLVDINEFISTADIIASRAIYPHNLFKKWNSTICMGFLYLKSNVTFVEEFFKEVGNIVQNDNYPDDQKTMNELLDINNVTWPKMALDRNDVDMGKIIWSGTNTSHVIALLPHDKFIRKCHDQTMARGSSLDARLQTVNNLANTRVAHCRTTKGQGRMKANTLKVYKLWKLRHGWQLSLEKFLRKNFNKKGKRYIEHMMNALKI